jgi:competence protein ComEC
LANSFTPYLQQAYWRDLARAEQDRWPLWLPIALAAGTGGYFALDFEPAAAWGWAALGLGLVLAAVAIAGWRRALLALFAALLIGFGVARLRTAAVQTPVLDSALIAHLTGRIVSLEPRAKGVRVVLDEVRSGAFGPHDTPRRVRLALRSGAFRPGEWLSLTAKMDAAPPPTQPGAADLGRDLFFQSIGAVGFVYGRARIIVAARPPDLAARIGEGVEALRQRMTQRIQSVLPGSTGGIASALITGTRGGINDADEAALRDAGLAHVLAIAGLHMALVGGGLFWLLRVLLAAVPAIALRWPIKKWAAGGALLASAFYLVISGAAPSSVRAFVMLALVMCAILLDRPALSMRSLALAATILLLMRPESLTEPGFQMSFAAVVALVAVAEWQQRRARVPRGVVWRYAVGIAMVSLVGSLATLPFAMFHFGRATHYAVLGNLLAMPVMGFWVMPAAAAAVVLMPLGWDAPALHLLGAGINVMLVVGRWVAGLPGAVSLAPAMPLSALVAMTLGGLWLAIWRRGWRWLGLGPVALGIGLALSAPLPQMLVAGDAQTIAVRGDDGLLHFLRAPKDKFVAREWLRRDGDGREFKAAVGLAGLHCDGVGCVLKKRAVIAVSWRPEALTDDCALAKVLVSTADAACREPAIVIDRKSARDGEGWRVSLSSLTAQSVRAARGARPWVPKPNNAE